MLSNFKWYRRLRGGIWVQIFVKTNHGVEFWKRFQNDTSDDEIQSYLIHGLERIVDTEKYSKYYLRRNKIKLIIKQLEDEQDK